MKRQIKKNPNYKLLMLFTIFTFLFVMTACTSDESQTTPEEPIEATDEVVDEVESEPILFTINILDRTNPRNGFVLTDLATDEEIEIEFERGANDWWIASFYSEADEIQLKLAGLNSWQTPFDQSFVLTTSFPTIYIFGTEMVSLVYTKIQDETYIEFTVISWQETVEIAGSFNEWVPVEISEADEDLLKALTPVGAQVNPTRNIYSGSFSIEDGEHEFKMLRGGTWSNGENATITVPN